MSGALSAWRSGLIRESARKSPKEHPPGKFSCCVGGSGMRLRAGLVLFMLSQKGVSNARDTEWRRFRGDGTRSRVRGGAGPSVGCGRRGPQRRGRQPGGRGWSTEGRENHSTASQVRHFLETEIREIRGRCLNADVWTRTLRTVHFASSFLCLW